MPSSLASTARACAALALATACARGQSPDEAAKLEFFEQRIRPVLASSCYECHSTHGKQRGGVVLDHRAGMRAEASEGPIVAPGEPAESVLLMVLRHELEGLEMPEDG
ncbi:MAG: c-type cytochrome domain-containing protein, partial [Planctomycetota bacterium]|nr:c-type cytochrome domain-containing protein [Planctomycetota bacterium]